MAYVYAVVFEGNIVKFGRSVDPYKRVGDHVTDGRRYGKRATLAMISYAANDVMAERDILDETIGHLKSVSQESFEFGKLSEVFMCFTRARLDPMVFSVGDKPYRLMVDRGTFRFDPDCVSELKKDDDPMLSVKKGIIKSIAGEDAVDFDHIKACNRGKRVSDLKATILSLEKTGHIAVKRWKNPFTDIPSSDLDRAKFMLTQKSSYYI